MLECWKCFRSHYSITPSLHYSVASSGHCQEFLPNAQLQKLRKENLGDENCWGKFAVEIVSLSLDSFGRVTKIVPAFSAIASFSDQLRQDLTRRIR